MARLQFSNAKFSKVISDEVTGKVIFDLGKKGTDTSTRFTAESNKIQSAFLNKTEKQLAVMTQKRYNEAIQQIQDILKSGFTSRKPRWKKFSPRYAKYKSREYPATAKVFWKRKQTNGLSGSFGSFAGPHKSAVTRSKAVTKLLNVKFVKSKGLLVSRYQMEMVLPEPKTGTSYLKPLLQQSFFTGEDAKPIGEEGTLEGELATLAYLESLSSSNRHRPFVGKLMGKAGVEYLKQFNRLIKSLKI